MSRFNHKTPKLPQALLDQIEPSSGNGGGKRGRKPSAPLGRREKRKALREQKKGHRTQHRPVFRSKAPEQTKDLEDDSEEDDEDIPLPLPKKKTSGITAADAAPKSILKNPSKEFRSTKPAASPSPEPPARVSRVVKEKLDEDDAEIAALEKKLGIKKTKKLPKSFEDDGLEDLLDGIDEAVGASSSKRKREEYDAWLGSKRRNIGADDDSASEEEDAFDSEASTVESDDGVDDLEEDEGLGFREGGNDSESNDGEDEDLNEDFEGFDSEESEPEEPRRVRENPYVPPVSAKTASSGKYVPPSMRGVPSSDIEELSKLRRQIRGLVNRLSESNLPTILREMENVYHTNPRQHVTSILIDILMDLVRDRTGLMDTFIILHAGFIASVYKVIGPHFGAQLLERVVLEFEKQYEAEKESLAGNKETSNLIALLAEMYTFQVVGSRIVFDYIRIFLNELSDLNTELLLKIIKNCGPQLRHDDPSSLKDIVILLQKQVAQVGEASLPVRTKFMIETIDNLKNNRQKTGLVASSISAEHTTRMKKTLGTLNAKAGTSSEPLGVSLTDIKGSKKEGKWWLVGASWRNDTSGADLTSHESTKSTYEAGSFPNVEGMHQEDGTTDLIQLAKEQRMNTDIRRAIFVNIMSASDYKDAHLRLTKLKLKKAQELEIPRVLIHCSSAEKVYNPYYTLIAKRLCSDHRFKWAFQYGLWDLFRRMGEKNELSEDAENDDDEDSEDIDLRKIVNLGRMYGNMIAAGDLSITVLKTLNFAYLQPKTKSFLEIMLLTALKTVLQNSKKSKGDSQNAADAAIVGIFSKAKDTPQVVAGLQYFLTKQVSTADFTSNAVEKKVLKSALRTATDILVHLSSSTSVA